MWLLQHTTICHASRRAAATLTTFHIISLDKSVEHLNTGWHNWNNEVDNICRSRNVSTFLSKRLQAFHIKSINDIWHTLKHTLHIWHKLPAKWALRCHCQSCWIVVYRLEHQPLYHTVYTSPKHWIKTHCITASCIPVHRQNNFNSQDFNYHPFLMYIYITWVILTEILILIVMVWRWLSWPHLSLCILVIVTSPWRWS